MPSNFGLSACCASVSGRSSQHAHALKPEGSLLFLCSLSVEPAQKPTARAPAAHGKLPAGGRKARAVVDDAALDAPSQLRVKRRMVHSTGTATIARTADKTNKTRKTAPTCLELQPAMPGGAFRFASMRTDRRILPHSVLHHRADRQSGQRSARCEDSQTRVVGPHGAGSTAGKIRWQEDPPRRAHRATEHSRCCYHCSTALPC